jgi:hypothetical protein
MPCWVLHQCLCQVEQQACHPLVLLQDDDQLLHGLVITSIR